LDFLLVGNMTNHKVTDFCVGDALGLPMIYNGLDISAIRARMENIIYLSQNETNGLSNRNTPMRFQLSD
jgi:hypothetical protein